MGELAAGGVHVERGAAQGVDVAGAGGEGAFGGIRGIGAGERGAGARAGRRGRARCGRRPARCRSASSLAVSSRSALLWIHRRCGTSAIASATAARPASGSRASRTTMARSARCSSLACTAHAFAFDRVAAFAQAGGVDQGEFRRHPGERVSRSRSRVVPAMSVTIARSLPASALSSELLPAFGGPTITACRPSRRLAAAFGIGEQLRELRRGALAGPRALAAPPSVSIDSSAKSIAASTCTRRCEQLGRRPRRRVARTRRRVSAVRRARRAYRRRRSGRRRLRPGPGRACR